ncbi:MAG: DpnII family type II restriction endonuclease [Anaerostipes sp.]|nr:DpnII family type II restriction endonuclease [Anaerostipes sp.]MDD3746441.1 DpnII family type II restriction endonuclease [Anaerostipes sp.]
MPDIKATKLSYDELFNSTTMFYMNPDYEAEIGKVVEAKTADISVGLRTIKDKESLKQYIIDHKDALDNLTSIAEISVERFKRMVSMIRKDRGFVFGTEWGLSKIRTAMMDSPAMMESILNLLWDGRNDEKMQSCIPAFYLENMAMDPVTLSMLQDENTVRRLVKRGLEGKYSNGIGDAVLSDIEKELKRVCAKHGLEFQNNVRVPLLDRAVSFVLESPTNPRVIIDVSYSVTTSSSQGSKKEAARKTVEVLNSEKASGRNIVYINFLDGAGWIGRQSDMKEIHRCSDYVLNFQNIGLLEDIIDTHIDEI